MRYDHKCLNKNMNKTLVRLGGNLGSTDTSLEVKYPCWTSEGQGWDIQETCNKHGYG